MQISGVSPLGWVMDVCIESFGDRKVIYDVMVTLEEHLFADLVYNQGEHGQHSRAEISACT